MSEERHSVYTRYGWFSLDKGSYKDYLAGKSWITWPPLKEEPIPPNISRRAAVLRNQAEQYGFVKVADSLNYRDIPIPHVEGISNVSVNRLDLSVKTSNAVLNGNIHTVGELLKLIQSNSVMENIKNLGHKGSDEVRYAVAGICYARLQPYDQAVYWQNILDQNADI